MNPILSVVVVTYNHRKYIKKCLDSIMMQKTEFEFEVIVADDNSSDRTVEYVKELYEDRVKIINREKNVGLCRNIYETYSKVKGKYIFDCSGDDYLPVNSVFQKHVDFLETHQDFFSVSNWYEYYDISQKNIRLIEIPYSEYTMLDFLKGVHVEFYLGTMRNTFRGDAPFFVCDASRNNEEIQMIYYTLSKGKKGILPEALYTYCYREGQEASNYCSIRTTYDVLNDYAKGFQAIEKVDKGKHKFDIAKVNYYEKYFDKIYSEEKIIGIYKVLRIVGWKDFIRFLFIKVLMKFNNRNIPRFLIREKRLVKTDFIGE